MIISLKFSLLEYALPCRFFHSTGKPRDALIFYNPLIQILDAAKKASVGVPAVTDRD